MTKNRFREMALERAQKPWGQGWSLLTEDHRDALIAREALMLVMGQCDTLEKFDAAKSLIRQAMGWGDDQ